MVTNTVTNPWAQQKKKNDKKTNMQRIDTTKCVMTSDHDNHQQTCCFRDCLMAKVKMEFKKAMDWWVSFL